MSTISVGSLPIIDELYEDDMVLVQAKGRTGLLKFTDFVIGEQQVSFYQEIVNSRNSIYSLTLKSTENITSIDANTAAIQELESKYTSHDSSISLLQSTTEDLQSQNVNMQSTLSGVAILANTVLNTSVERLTEATDSNNRLSNQYENLTATTTENIQSLQDQFEALQATVNSINNSLYIATEQISTQQATIDALQSGSTGNDTAGGANPGDTGGDQTGGTDTGGGQTTEPAGDEWYDTLGEYEADLIGKMTDAGFINASSRGVTVPLTADLLDTGVLLLREADATLFTKTERETIELEWWFRGTSPIFETWLSNQRTAADAA
jgi:hypothetical protein